MSLTILALAASVSLNFTKISWARADEGIYELLTTADLDGDGTSDDAVISLRCAKGKHIAQAIITAREAGSGMPTGRRKHPPATSDKEWSAVPDEVAKVRASWDRKSSTKRWMAPESIRGRAIDLQGGDELCAALQATKSRSDIQNN